MQLVSIIIPCVNEERYIKDCLESLINQDYPKENLEILVVDGMSKDKTREIINNYCKKYSFIKLLDNPNKFTCFAFNIGIKESKGDVVIIMGAHSSYSDTYISKCVKYLKEYNADNVGGVIKTIPRNDTLVAKAIAFCLSHPFGVGGSIFRSGSDEAREVDTVFGGCYKKEIFDKVGLFNEKLLRSQDMELNLRIKRGGGKVMLIPDIISYYYPKDNLVDFLKHNFLDGIWATYPSKITKVKLGLRHYVPLIFTLTLFGSFLLGLVSIFFSLIFTLTSSFYLLALIVFSFNIARRENDWNYLFVMPIVFIIRHFAYGVGSMYGLIKK